MAHNSSHPVKAWIIIILFFAIIIAVGLIISFECLHRDYPVWVAVFEGSFFGFLSIWLPLFVGFRVLKAKKRFTDL